MQSIKRSLYKIGFPPLDDWLKQGGSSVEEPVSSETSPDPKAERMNAPIPLDVDANSIRCRVS